MDRLEKQGLIKRTPHPTDRRSTIAQMTPAGRALTGKAINLLNAEFFRDLGLSDREAHLLIGLLMKMRRSWNDIKNPEGWEPFEVGLDAPPPTDRGSTAPWAARPYNGAAGA